MEEPVKVGFGRPGGAEKRRRNSVVRTRLGSGVYVETPLTQKSKTKNRGPAKEARKVCPN